MTNDTAAPATPRYWLLLAVVVSGAGAVYQAVSIRFLAYVFPFHMLFAISLISSLAIFFTGLGALLSRRWRDRHRPLTGLLFLLFPLSAAAMNLADRVPFLAGNPVAAAILLTAPALFTAGALSGIAYHETAVAAPGRLKHLIALSALAFFAGYLLSVYLFTALGVWNIFLATTLLILLPLLRGRPAWVHAALLAAILLVPAADLEGPAFRLFARDPHLWETAPGRFVHGVWSPYARLDFYEMSDGRLAGLYNRTQQWAVGDPAGDLAVRRALYGRITGEVLVIGSGGGYGLLSLTNAASITAVELDPGVVAAMKGPLARYNRNIYNTVKKAHAGDGRAFLDGSDDRFDAVILEAADLSYTAIPHSFVSMENYLYTKEGIATALSRLRPDGLLLIMVTKELIPAPKFINALPDGVHWRLFEGEIEVIRSIQMNFDFILASPSADRIAAWETILGDPALRLRPVGSSDLARKSSFGLDPITDDRPLLYFKGWEQAVPFFALLFLLLATGTVVVSTAARRNEALFFSALGVAFMLAELHIINGMRAYLGGYLETSSILLGTLVLGGAAGTLVHDRLPDRARTIGLALTLPLMIALLRYAPLSWPFAAKALYLIAALAPAAFFMGTLFPTGLARAQSEHAARHYATDTIGASLGLVLFYLLMLAGGFPLVAVATLACYGAAVLSLNKIR